MRTLFLDCGMGIAGDMLMGALYECLPDKALFLKKMLEIGIEKVSIVPEKVNKCGIIGTHMKVLIDGIEEESLDHHDHAHNLEHSHEHVDEHHHDDDNKRNNDSIDHASHHHFHTSFAHIEEMISKLNLNEALKAKVLSVYKEIVTAESKVHGVPVEQIHFHEVGNLDAVADIVANIVLLDMLQIERVIATPINIGFGKVKCAHGILPVPAPATAEILKGIPVYAGQFEGEMCTPTGAALYKTIVNETSTMPVMTMERIGYGCGKKDFAAANVVRAVIGESDNENSSKSNDTDTIIELSCNIDDMSAEDIALAEELILLHGALDVFTSSIQMKKNRPGTMLSVLCHPENKQKMAELMFKHTTTIGIRQYHCDRMILSREIKEIDTPYGLMHYKQVEGYGITRAKIEFEDLKNAVEQYEKTIEEVRQEIEKLL